MTTSLPQPGAPLRVPLQTGQSALRWLALGGGGVAIGSLILVAGVGLLPFVGRAAFAVVALGLTIAGWGVVRLRRAIRWRASDLIVSGDGVRIQGGSCEW